MKHDLTHIMHEEWDKVRASLFYPSLPDPELSDKVSNGLIDMQNQRIRINPDFVEELGQKGFSPRRVFNEVLTHEAIHYLRFPGTVVNMLRMHKIGKRVYSDKRAQTYPGEFTEIQTNTYQVLVHKCPDTIAIRSQFAPPGDFEQLIYGVYQHLWDADLGVKLSPERERLAKNLSEIDYLDKENELLNLETFLQMLKRHTFETPFTQFSKWLMSALGNEEGSYSISSDGDRFSDDEIKEGMRIFAAECDTPEEFEKVVKDFVEELKDKGVGNARSELALASDYYSARAQAYKVPIAKKQMESTGAQYPITRGIFDDGDDFDTLDVTSTPTLMPGVTEKWLYEGSEGYMSSSDVPDNLIIHDNSPSMPNPNSGFSVPVLASTVIANAYLDANREVAVYSFGSKDIVTPFTRDRNSIYETLRWYSGKNGGTVISREIIDRLVQRYPTSFDITVVSDMGISNLEELINVVQEIPTLHRIHLVYNMPSVKLDNLRKYFGDKENVAFIPILWEENISDLVMGELTKSIQ